MLGVTPGAVTHQIRQIEQEIGTRLFSYRNNGIDLTPDGSRYFQSVHPALISIERANREILRGEMQVNVRASTSFALSWLIPRLPEFYLAHPKIEVAVEACRLPITLEHGVDIAITYARLEVMPSSATFLIADYVRPVCHPQLLKALRGDVTLAESVPLLSGTQSDWDLQRWAELNAIPAERLRVAARFDIDYAAVAACKAGLGVYLAPDFLVEKEITQGVLVPLGRYIPCQIGNYWISTAKPLRKSATRFSKWLRTTVASTAAATANVAIRPQERTAAGDPMTD